MNKIVPAAAAALVAAAGLVGLSSGSAQAAPVKCNAQATLPAGVTVINKPTTTIPLTLVTDCANYVIGARLVGPGSAPGGVALFGSSTATISFESTLTRGSYTAYLKDGSAAYADSAHTMPVGITWTPTTMVLKGATASYSANTRKGTAMYVHGLFKEYNTDGTNTYAGTSGKTVYLQRLLGTTWQTMLSRTTSTGGNITVGFVQTTRYQYRWVMAASDSSVASTSNVTTG